MAKEILIIEDGGLIAGLLNKDLSQKGYTIAVLEPKDAIKQARKYKPSLVILDTPASEAETTKTCQLLHEATAAPIIALSESPKALNDVEGVTYLSKPTDFRDLLAAIEKGLKIRRPRKPRTARFLRLGDLTLDLQTQHLIKGEKYYYLTPKLFLLLKMFMSNPGQVLSHKLIMQEVWDTDYVDARGTLYVHVSWIRQMIEDEPRKAAVLRTVRGVGYRFEVKP